MKPLALDLCCGKGGWTIGLLKAGWDVIGVDIEDMGGYPEGADLFIADILNLRATKTHLWDITRGGEERNFKKVSLVCASPPCQDFSYSSLPFKKARAKFSKENPPSDAIWRACERLAKDLDAPLILENVAGARKWIGPAAWHYGSFYFWGELPALIPIGCPRKGFGGGKNWKDRPMQDGRRNNKRGMPGEYESKVPITDMNISGPQDQFKRMVGSEKYRKIGGAEKAGHHGHSLRKQWSALVAMIPEELSTWIGECYYPRELRNVKS